MPTRPEKPADVDFDELRDARRRLVDIVKRHRASIEYFQESGTWFRLYDNDPVLKHAHKERNEVHHLSTSASCLESLMDVAPQEFPPNPTEVAQLQQLVDDFASAALGRKKWQSEGAANTYCRVRTLPLIMQFASPRVVAAHGERIARLITQAWSNVDIQMDEEKQRFPAIAEHVPLDLTEEEGKAVREGEQLGYPPNSFLTFWGVRSLRLASGRNVDALDKLSESHEQKLRTAMLWSRGNLANHVALASSHADMFDAQQLAWAIATIVDFSDPADMRQPASVALVKSGLGALFQAQDAAGNWQRGEPLFHYPESGNAYCYIFETLTELLRPAVRSAAGRQFRELLKPYAGNLLRAWRVAVETQQETGVVTIGWCSGHHPHRTQPESWATAAAFSFLQLLRRLVGHWTREAAADQLSVGTPRWPTMPAAEAKLAEYGDTWRFTSRLDIADTLAGLYLNPVLESAKEEELIDHDKALVRSNQARSAILFGPPGTGKTTLVEALAGALGWEYLEIHATSFLSQGIDNVPAQAERIFTQLMELDRCVVLFDEVDELIRARDEKESDPFGRFLTTSMLPKLAKLWDQGRVIFFANTNWIDRADPAIKRSQRFDAALYVAPPSFERKFEKIAPHLTEAVRNSLTQHDVDKALASNTTDNLGWLALLRYDQLDELSDMLRRSGGSDLTALRKALQTVGVQLANSDWQIRAGRASSAKAAFARFRAMTRHEHLDGRVIGVARLDKEPPSPPQIGQAVGSDPRFISVRMGLHRKPPSELRGDGWSAELGPLLKGTVVQTGP
ncbi:MAG: ATP-binding protein [Candidatus Dormibacteria bacterium]